MKYGGSQELPAALLKIKICHGKKQWDTEEI